MLTQQDDKIRKDIKENTRLNRMFVFYHSKGQKWRRRAKEYEQLVFNDIEGTGTQFTQKQLDKMEDTYGIPLSVNIAVAIKEQFQAFLTGVAPVIDVIPIGAQADKFFAYVWREIITGSLRMNNFSLQQEKAIGDLTTAGHGILHICPNRFFKYNEFNTVIKRLRYEHVYLDPNSTDKLFQDCEAQIIALPISKTRAKKEYKLTDEELKYAEAVMTGDTGEGAFDPSSALGDDISFQEPKIWIFEFFEKVRGMVYILNNGVRTCEEQPQDYVNEEGKYISTYIDSYDGVFVQRVVKVGNLIIDKELMPITFYPNFPYVAGHCDTPYTYPVMHYIVDLIHALNKIMAITIENAQKGSNFGMTAAEGSIVDEERFQRDRSTPGATTYYVPDASVPDGGRPQIVQPAQLSNAWFTLFKEIISLIEYITGIFDLMQGNAANAPQTMGATNNITNFGTQRVKMTARGLDQTNQELLNCMIEYIQAYAPPGNLMRYLADSEALMEIRTNVAGIIQQQSEQPGFEEKQGGQQMATIIENMTTENVKAILGDIKIGEYKVAYRSSNNLPTTRQMALQVIQTVMSRMSNDAMSMAVMKMALQLMDYPEVDKLLREADMVQQLQQQVEQLAEENGLLRKATKSAQEDVGDAKEGEKMAKMDADLSKLRSEVTSAIKEMKAKATASTTPSTETKRKPVKTYV